jgi:hypothetical protein
MVACFCCFHSDGELRPNHQKCQNIGNITGKVTLSSTGILNQKHIRAKKIVLIIQHPHRWTMRKPDQNLSCMCLPYSDYKKVKFANIIHFVRESISPTLLTSKLHWSNCLRFFKRTWDWNFVKFWNLKVIETQERWEKLPKATWIFTNGNLFFQWPEERFMKNSDLSWIPDPK